MLTVTFWRDAGERAIATAAQVLVVLLGADAVNLLTVPWLGLLGAAGGAALLSLLKALAATRIGDRGSASLLADDQYPPTRTF